MMSGSGDLLHDQVTTSRWAGKLFSDEKGLERTVYGTSHGKKGLTELKM